MRIRPEPIKVILTILLMYPAFYAVSVAFDFVSFWAAFPTLILVVFLYTAAVAHVWAYGTKEKK